MELTEVGWENEKWINFYEDRKKWRGLENMNEYYGSIKCREFLEQLIDFLSFSKRTLLQVISYSSS